MTLFEALASINAYPIPHGSLQEIAVRRGIALEAEIDAGQMREATYNLCVADVLMWLAEAPNVSQGGQSYSFDSEQRAKFRARAKALYDEFKDDAAGYVTTFGYKGSRL